MVYDCFMFFDELEALEIRLHELDSVVDRFVLVESDRTHSGKHKPLFFAENRGAFRAFEEKIIYSLMTDGDLPGDADSWTREHGQRDFVIRSLKGCSPSDVVIISDADEIASASAVASFQPGFGFRRCEQIHHYYYLNTRGGMWGGTVILTYEELCRLGSATAARHHPSDDGQLTRNGGWHFSYLGGPERIRRKLESFAHTDLDRDDLKDLQRLRARIDGNEDIFDRPGHRYRTVDLGERYPKWLLENRQQFQHVIRGQA